MNEHHGNSGASSTSASFSGSSLGTQDDHTIAKILGEEEENALKHTSTLGKRLSHLGSIPHVPRVIEAIPDTNDATLDHARLSERLAQYRLTEVHMEGDGNCQFRALADQIFQNPGHHKYVRRQVVKQLKRYRTLYEGYIPMAYKSYLKKMKRSGEWGDHVTLQAAADRFEAKICLVTSFRDTCYIEIIPNNNRQPSKELWLSFWSEVHYNSLYEVDGAIPTRHPRKKHWLF
ncbi:hypothetical protein DM860_011237 [Cuscuta australis]|uniref:ubiquitinyl hydrolase 1 n=1 Tax=Cuscuta australis TaxID=267555 RepID=A0A328DSY3_9ASTE|nr:hypothetical protein DM860_011237 [Cuscuta australis]